MIRVRPWLALAFVLALFVRGDVRPSTAASADAVHVRMSVAFAPCLAPALDAFTRSTGVSVVVTVAEPDPPEDADVVVGDDAEMTRLLEGGTADLGSAFDLGTLPWVLVAPGSASGNASALGAERIAVLGGAAGREAREWLGATGRGAVDVTRDGARLRQARQALVPRSLGGRGEARATRVRPLVATAAAIAGSPRRAAAQRLLAFLASAEGRHALGSCFDPAPATASTAAPSRAAAVYAHAVVDWWLPQCSLAHNRYNDPAEVLGPPDAVNFGGMENYQGFMSLGQGGYVTVDMGTTIGDGPGPDIRVFQTTSNEPVTVYASAAPTGPFALIGLRVSCGVRSPGLLSNHCDFDLHDGGVTAARYLKIEDGEIYPCLSGGTVTEGADIDAVQVLSTP
jgi:hypothetical protein